MASFNRSKNILNIIQQMSGTRLLVGDLSYNTHCKQLKEAFSRFGDVADVVILGSELRFGIVRFNNKESASSALSSMDGQILDGEIISVRYANGSRLCELENIHPSHNKTPKRTISARD